MTKRQIAERAMSPDGFKLVKAAYNIKRDEMRPFNCLYVVSPDDEEVSKIGIAIDPFKRLSAIQTCCWKRISLRALFWFPEEFENARLEYAALKLAKKEKVNLLGEWVDLPPDEAVGLVLTAANPDMRFTDNHGLIHDWFTDTRKQFLEAEEEFYTRPFKKKAA